jgi:ribosomal protein L17
MTSAKEYRQYAEECLTWAKQAKTDSERETLLKMAEDWLRAAAIEHNANAPVSPTRSGGPSPSVQ